jgi:hypothetical protein
LVVHEPDYPLNEEARINILMRFWLDESFSSRSMPLKTMTLGRVNNLILHNVSELSRQLITNPNAVAEAIQGLGYEMLFEYNYNPLVERLIREAILAQAE